MRKTENAIQKERNAFVDYLDREKGLTIEEIVGEHVIQTFSKNGLTAGAWDAEKQQWVNGLTAGESNPPVVERYKWSRPTVFRLLKRFERLIIREKIPNRKRGHPTYTYRIDPKFTKLAVYSFPYGPLSYQLSRTDLNRYYEKNPKPKIVTRRFKSGSRYDRLVLDLNRAVNLSERMKPKKYEN